MKLIIKQYLSSLRERDELDAILPDLLSQMGLNVISRPKRGTRQSGVDVAAVGKIDGEEEKVYLFSIKSGDLTRKTWNGEAVQSLRPSLDEIVDSYIPTRLPDEHKDKNVVICICIGGDIQEQVRTDVEGYIRNNKRENLTFEEWNGDKLASLILENFLREDLLPKDARAELRKSLALLDEPESSYKHFATLIKSLSKIKDDTSDERNSMVLRQINICLWILFAWARDIDNLESAYLSSELAALHAWEITKPYSTKDTMSANAIQLTLLSILTLHQQICTQYIYKKILPHVVKRHALSVAVRPSYSLDVNLKLFDLLGRLTLSGIWAYSGIKNEPDDESRRSLFEIFQVTSNATKQLILNNPALLLPVKDDQAIDVSIAVFLLMLDSNNHQYIRNWLSEIVQRSFFSYQTHGQYPCNLQNYGDLLGHPEAKDDDYRKKVTSGSILYPMISFWAALLGDNELYSRVQQMKKELLSHCNFQLWYPDEVSEERIYTNSDIHGAILSHVCVDRSSKELLKQIFDECGKSPYFEKLSAVESGLLPIILVACRHYRLPIPPHLWKGFQQVQTV
jgi:hypothetical protein